MGCKKRLLTFYLLKGLKQIVTNSLTLKLTMLLALHYVKSVQMRSFFWSVFSWNSGDTSSVFVREGYLIFPNKKILRQNILFD